MNKEETMNYSHSEKISCHTCGKVVKKSESYASEVSYKLIFECKECYLKRKKLVNKS